MENHNTDKVKLPNSNNKFINSLKSKIKNLWTTLTSKPIYIFTAVFAIIGCILLVNALAASSNFSGKISRNNPVGRHIVLVEAAGNLTATVRDTGGRRADNIRYALRLVKNDGQTITSFEATNVGEPVTLASTVAPGSYIIEVSSKDSLSKRGTTYSLGVTYPDPVPPAPIDTQAPTITISQPIENATIGSSVTISGTASDGSSVTVVNYRFTGGNWQTATGTTNWSGLLDSKTQVNGTATIEVQAKDNAGNIGTKSLIVTVYNQVVTPNPAGAQPTRDNTGPRYPMTDITPSQFYSTRTCNRQRIVGNVTLDNPSMLAQTFTLTDCEITGNFGVYIRGGGVPLTLSEMPIINMDYVDINGGMFPLNATKFTMNHTYVAKSSQWTVTDVFANGLTFDAPYIVMNSVFYANYATQPVHTEALHISSGKGMQFINVAFEQQGGSITNSGVTATINFHGVNALFDGCWFIFDGPASAYYTAYLDAGDSIVRNSHFERAAANYIYPNSPLKPTFQNNYDFPSGNPISL